MSNSLVNSNIREQVYKKTFNIPFFFMIGYLVTEYSKPQVMYSFLYDLPLAELVVTAAIVSHFFQRAGNGLFFETKSIQNILILIFCGTVILSYIGAQTSGQSFEPVLTVLKLVVIYSLIINIVNTPKRIEIFIWVLLLLNLKLAQHKLRVFLGELASGIPLNILTQRGTNIGIGFFANDGDFGVAMCVVVPFAFYLISCYAKKSVKLLLIGMGACFVAAIYVTGTRGAALGLAAMVIMAMFKSRRKSVSLGVTALFAIGLLIFASNAYKDRLRSGIEYERDPTAMIRINLWKAGIAMFEDYPITGVGIGNFGTVYKNQYYTGLGEGDRMYTSWAPHSIWIEALSELGLSGFIVLLLIILFIFRANKDTRNLALRIGSQGLFFKNMANSIDVSLIGYLVSGSFLTVLYYPHLWMILSLSVALKHITTETDENGVNK